MKNDKFDFKNWFDREVEELKNDPEYIANGIMIDLAAQVAKKLEKENLRQKDLAKRLDKSPGWISRFMNDPTNFSVKKLVEIAVVLGMELNIQFREAGKMSAFDPKTVSGRTKPAPQQGLGFGSKRSTDKVDKNRNFKKLNEKEIAA